MKSISKIKQLFEAVSTCFKEFKPLCAGYEHLLIEGDLAEGAPVVEQVDGMFRSAKDQDINTDHYVIVIKDGVVASFGCIKDTAEDAGSDVIEDAIGDAIEGKVEEHAPTVDDPTVTFSVNQEMWDALQSEISAIKDQIAALAPKIEEGITPDDMGCVSSDRGCGSRDDQFIKILGKLSSL